MALDGLVWLFAALELLDAALYLSDAAVAALVAVPVAVSLVR